MRAGATIETAIDFLPKGGADVSFDKGTLSINYTPTDINIDWENINSSVVEFVPGNIEFIVKEHPRVEIEYVASLYTFRRVQIRLTLRPKSSTPRADKSEI